MNDQSAQHTDSILDISEYGRRVNNLTVLYCWDCGFFRVLSTEIFEHLVFWKTLLGNGGILIDFRCLCPNHPLLRNMDDMPSLQEVPAVQHPHTVEQDAVASVREREADDVAGDEVGKTAA